MILKLFSGVFGLDGFSVFEDVSRREVSRRALTLLPDVFNRCHLERLHHLLGFFSFGLAECGTVARWFFGIDHVPNRTIEIL